MANMTQKKFRVEVTESYHDSFDVEADSEQEARRIVEGKLNSEELTCRNGLYSRAINHVYPAEG